MKKRTARTATAGVIGMLALAGGVVTTATPSWASGCGNERVEPNVEIINFNSTLSATFPGGAWLIWGNASATYPTCHSVEKIVPLGSATAILGAPWGPQTGSLKYGRYGPDGHNGAQAGAIRDATGNIILAQYSVNNEYVFFPSGAAEHFTNRDNKAFTYQISGKGTPESTARLYIGSPLTEGPSANFFALPRAPHAAYVHTQIASNRAQVNFNKKKTAIARVSLDSHLHAGKKKKVTETIVLRNRKGKLLARTTTTVRTGTINKAKVPLSPQLSKKLKKTGHKVVKVKIRHSDGTRGKGDHLTHLHLSTTKY